MTAPAPPLPDADFAFLRDLVHRRSGIVLDEDKRYLVQTRLAPLAAEHADGDLSALVGQLRRRPTAPLHADVVEAFTTNETSFFRDPSLFDALRTRVLPALVERNAPTRRLTVWSAACSTGQEPYSLLMLLRRHFPQLSGWTVSVVGTDLSRTALERARAGRYTRFEVSRGLPAPMLAEFFTGVGRDWQIDPRLRDSLTLHHLNLADSWARLPPCDLVLMRNVLIYFDAATKEELLRRAARQLRPSGCLVLGSTERPTGAEDVLEPVILGQARVYQPRGGPTLGA